MSYAGSPTVLCVCVCACVRACVRACVCACVRVCVRVCVRACVRACVYLHMRSSFSVQRLILYVSTCDQVDVRSIQLTSEWLAKIVK